jgi:hypothetical protein
MNPAKHQPEAPLGLGFGRLVALIALMRAAAAIARHRTPLLLLRAPAMREGGNTGIRRDA